MVVCQLAGQKGGAGRAAERIGDVILRESGALGLEEGGRLRHELQVVVAHVVGDHDKHLRGGTALIVLATQQKELRRVG